VKADFLGCGATAKSTRIFFVCAQTHIHIKVTDKAPSLTLEKYSPLMAGHVNRQKQTQRRRLLIRHHGALSFLFQAHAVNCALNFIEL